MATVMGGLSMSLDGFIAYQDDSFGRSRRVATPGPPLIGVRRNETGSSQLTVW